MLKNYSILAFRNLLKRKVYSFINIFGLAIGVAVCLVILKYVEFELSYDNYHKNADSIYRTLTTSYRNGESRGTSPVSGYAQGPSLAADIPEIKTYVRTHPMYGGAVVSNDNAVAEPLRFHEENIQFVDSTFLDVFSYEILQGDLNTALDRPSSIVLTQAMAQKYFTKADKALGKMLKISGGWADGDYQVTGVLADNPQNSHFTFDFLVSIHNLLQNGQYKDDKGWGWNNFITYVELNPHANLQTLNAKTPAFIKKYKGDDLEKSNSKEVLVFQPIRNIHLSTGNDLEPSAVTGMSTIYFFIIISIFILSIAWINYINLSTARAMERAREVGIKKSIGVFRSQLITQFLFESVLVNFIGVALAVLLAIALLPVLGAIVDKAFVFDFTDYKLWSIIGGLFLFGSLVSGAYPAFVLSSFNPTTVLKGGVEKAGQGFSLRKALVVFQFASSLILIAGTFAIYRQIQFMRTTDKGFTMEQMLIVNGPSVLEREGADEKLITLKNELKKIASVKQVTTSGAIPGGGYNWGTGMRKDGAPVEEDKSGSVVWVDTDFIDAYGIKLLAGKTWNPDAASDMKSVLINEASLKAFGLGDAQHALQERIILGDDTIAILGVLKNYNWNSLKSEHTPFLLMPSKISRRSYSIHLSGGNIPDAIASIEKQYKTIFPGNPFDYYFLDDFFNKQYKDDQQFGNIFSLFAGLAIIIACLGLWGLASFTTTQKLKEISIRKVLGASVSSIMSLLSAQFLKLVLIASAIALPLTWYGVHTWLEHFAFKIGMGWELFVIPVLILAVIALSTVSVTIFKGANSNPAKVLRSE